MVFDFGGNGGGVELAVDLVEEVDREDEVGDAHSEVPLQAPLVGVDLPGGECVSEWGTVDLSLQHTTVIAAEAEEVASHVFGHLYLETERDGDGALAIGVDIVVAAAEGGEFAEGAVVVGLKLQGEDAANVVDAYHGSRMSAEVGAAGESGIVERESVASEADSQTCLEGF